MLVSHQIPMEKYAASIDDVRSAAKRIEGIGHKTPVLTSKTLDQLAGRKLFFNVKISKRLVLSNLEEDGMQFLC